MTIKIAENLYLPYDEISRFLEKIPSGMTYDIMLQKIPSLRFLKKKETEKLLEYIRVKGRIIVIETSAKNGVSSPLLRHKMHTAPLSSIEQPKIDLPLNTVYAATQGRVTLMPEKKPTPKAETATVEEVKEPTLPELRTLHLKEPHLVKAAEAVYNALTHQSNGYSRTEIGNKVVEYHRLRGTDRDILLNYLIAREGVTSCKVEKAGTGKIATKYFHPNFTKKLDENEQRFDHAAPTLSLDKVDQLSEKPGVMHNVLSRNPVLSVPAEDKEEPVAEPSVRELIIDMLLQGSGYMPMYRLYHYVPAYAELTESERDELIGSMLEKEELFIYQGKHPNNESSITWISLERKVVNNPPVVANSAMADAMNNALNKNSEIETPAVNTEEVNTPVTAITPVSPMSSAELRQHILSLEKTAILLEEKERDGELVESVKVLRDVIVEKFAAVQKALDAQIDAQAELGAAINQLNEVLSK